MKSINLGNASLSLSHLPPARGKILHIEVDGSAVRPFAEFGEGDISHLGIDLDDRRVIEECFQSLVAFVPGYGGVGESGLEEEQRVCVVTLRSNVGDTVWLASPSAVGGFVTVGCKLAGEDGRVISDALGRTELAADVGPGENANVIVTFSLPRELSPGVYHLSFDLVNELVCWFSDLGNVPITHSLSVSVSPG